MTLQGHCSDKGDKSMVKVTYVDGTKREFDYRYFRHNAEHKLFVLSGSNNEDKCMIPDRNVLEIEEVK